MGSIANCKVFCKVFNFYDVSLVLCILVADPSPPSPPSKWETCYFPNCFWVSGNQTSYYKACNYIPGCSLYQRECQAVLFNKPFLSLLYYLVFQGCPVKRWKGSHGLPSTWDQPSRAQSLLLADQYFAKSNNSGIHRSCETECSHP